MAGQISQAGIQGGLGTVGTIFGIVAGMKWDKELSKLKEKNPKYTSSPYAAKTLALAETLLNSRMPGAAARERNIYGSGANAMAGVTRNATDASQALATAAGIQGQQTDAFNSLQMQEGQDYYNKLNNLNAAYGGMTQEHKDLFDDEVRRWQDQVNIITAQYKARKQGGQDISNYGAMMGGLVGGAVGGVGGGGGGGGTGMSGMSGMMGSISDKRLKHNYYVIGKSPSGINIYEFSYLGSNIRYQGVMADEVPKASFNVGEYLAVDYSKIDVQFKQLK